MIERPGAGHKEDLAERVGGEFDEEEFELEKANKGAGLATLTAEVCPALSWMLSGFVGSKAWLMEATCPFVAESTEISACSGIRSRA